MKTGIRKATRVRAIKTVEMLRKREMESQTADEKLKPEVSLLEFGCNPLLRASLALLRLSQGSVSVSLCVCACRFMHLA